MAEYEKNIKENAMGVRQVSILRMSLSHGDFLYIL